MRVLIISSYGQVEVRTVKWIARLGDSIFVDSVELKVNKVVAYPDDENFTRLGVESAMVLQNVIDIDAILLVD